MKLYGLIVAALTSLAAIAVAEKPVSAKIDFSRGWSFMKCPAEWPVEFNKENKTMEPVILPHTWNAEDMGVPLQNSIRVQNGECQVKSILLFCINEQGKRLNGPVLPLVLSPVLQIQNATPARDRVSEKAAGNTCSLIRQASIPAL